MLFFILNIVRFGGEAARRWEMPGTLDFPHVKDTDMIGQHLAVEFDPPVRTFALTPCVGSVWEAGRLDWLDAPGTRGTAGRADPRTEAARTAGRGGVGFAGGKRCHVPVCQADVRHLR